MSEQQQQAAEADSQVTELEGLAAAMAQNAPAGDEWEPGPGDAAPPEAAGPSAGESMAGLVVMLGGFMGQRMGPHWAVSMDEAQMWAQSFDKAYPDAEVSPKVEFWGITAALVLPRLAAERAVRAEARERAEQQADAGAAGGDSAE